MRAISDYDYKLIGRLLGAFIATPHSGTNREKNDRRLARLLLSKLKRKNDNATKRNHHQNFGPR